MEITQGIKTKGGIRTMHILKLTKKLYAKRKVSMVWNQYLTKGLEEIVF